MTRKAIVLTLLTIAVFLLACGVSTVPAQVSTQSPIIKTYASPMVIWQTATLEPETRVICPQYATVNARGMAEDMSFAVIHVLTAGTIVTLTGEETTSNGETWQPTNFGAIDPKFLCVR